jgi:ribose 1,5-bisphosphokinase PhnN
MRKDTLITLAECKARLAESGWAFSHRSIIRTYVFTSENHHWKEVAFTLAELRHAARHGF